MCSTGVNAVKVDTKIVSWIGKSRMPGNINKTIRQNHVINNNRCLGGHCMFARYKCDVLPLKLGYYPITGF